MGTINYKTSDIITVGSSVMFADLFNDPETIAAAQECGINPADYDQFYEFCNDEYYYYITGLQSEIEELLSAYNFEFFKVQVIPGYYDGIQIDIQDQYTCFLPGIGEYIWNCYEKAETLKELTTMQEFLIKCIDLGLNVCYPGWCTKYENHAGSISAVKSAIKAEKEKVKNIPVYSKVKKIS